MQEQSLPEEKLGLDELLEYVHSVNLYDRAKTLKACLEDELEYVLKKVGEYKKAGEINLKIKIGIGDRNQLNITGEVTSKSPKGYINQNIFYQDYKDGSIYLDDPNQIKLFKVERLKPEEQQTQLTN